MFDVHTHFVPQEVLEWIRENSGRIGASFDKKVPGKEPFLTINQKWSFELKQAFYQPDLYIEEQEKARVKHSLVSPIPQLFLYDFEVSVTAEAATLYNRALANWVRKSEGRISALATLPLNSPEHAATELRNAIKLGLRGAIIGPGHSGVPLSDERYSVFWEEADVHKAIVFVHPLLNADPRIQRRKMPNMIGVPWETTIAALDILLSGILDKYPNVKILLAHGGGFLPYQVGRLEKAYQSWGDVSSSMRMEPREYLKRFWYDSVLWNESSIHFLQELVGQDRVLPGSDFPFDLKTWPPQVSDECSVKKFLGC